jgi:hypothetical protein
VAETLAEKKEAIAEAGVAERRKAEPKVHEEVKDPEEIAKRLKAAEEDGRKKATKKIERDVQGVTAGHLQLSQEVGGLVGRFVLALLIIRIASRRSLIRLFQVPGLLVVPIVFAVFTIENQVLFTLGAWQVSLLHFGIFLVGLLTVAQMSFWGNYLPVVYPVHLRGTGESMAHNIGGRMLGTSFAAVTSMLSSLAPGADDATRMAYTAAAIGLLVYVLGFAASFFLPEPREETMRE